MGLFCPGAVAMSRAVKVRDLGWSRIKEAAKELNGAGVKVGLRAGKASGDVIEYGVWNEFGTKRIPKRPFMRHTADVAESDVKGLMRKWAAMVVSGTMTAPQALGTLGLYYQGRIQAMIRNSPSWAKPNAPSTIRAKGSTKPLVDHGVLINSIDWQRDDKK